MKNNSILTSLSNTTVDQILWTCKHVAIRQKMKQELTEKFSGDTKNISELIGFITDLDDIQALDEDEIFAYLFGPKDAETTFKECNNNSIVFNYYWPFAPVKDMTLLNDSSEQFYFFIDAPLNRDNESVEGKTQRQVFYIDGCNSDNILALTYFCHFIFCQNDMCNWGVGCMKSQDEVLFNQYDMCRINSRHIDRYLQLPHIKDMPTAKSLLADWNLLTDTFGLKTNYKHAFVQGRTVENMALQKPDIISLNTMTVDDVLARFKHMGPYLGETY